MPVRVRMTPDLAGLTRAQLLQTVWPRMLNYVRSAIQGVGTGSDIPQEITLDAPVNIP